MEGKDFSSVLEAKNRPLSKVWPAVNDLSPVYFIIQQTAEKADLQIHNML